MKAKIATFIGLLMLAGCLSAITADELYLKMSSSYKNIQSYQANVKQTNYFQDIDSSINYSGKMYFIPGRMLIHFDKPSLQRLLIEKGTFTLYDQSSNTIYTSQILQQYQRMNPLELLQLYWHRSTVSVKAGKAELVNVSLKPKKDSMLISISASINSKSGLVQSLSYQDCGGNQVSYSFSNIQLNKTIDASVWNFNYPKDAQRIQD